MDNHDVSRIPSSINTAPKTSAIGSGGIFSELWIGPGIKRIVQRKDTTEYGRWDEVYSFQLKPP